MNFLSSLLNNRDRDVLIAHQISGIDISANSSYHSLQFCKYNNMPYFIADEWSGGGSYDRNIVLYHVENGKCIRDTAFYSYTHSSSSDLYGFEWTDRKLKYNNASFTDSVMPFSFGKTSNDFTSAACDLRYGRAIGNFGSNIKNIYTEQYWLNVTGSGPYTIKVYERSDLNTAIRTITIPSEYGISIPLAEYNGTLYYRCYSDSGKLTIIACDIVGGTCRKVFEMAKITELEDSGYSWVRDYSGVLDHYCYFMLASGAQTTGGVALGCLDFENDSVSITEVDKSLFRRFYKGVDSSSPSINSETIVPLSTIGYRNGKYFIDFSLSRGALDVPVLSIDRTELGRTDWFYQKFSNCVMPNRNVVRVYGGIMYSRALPRYILLANSVYDLDKEKELPLEFSGGLVVNNRYGSANSETGYDPSSEWVAAYSQLGINTMNADYENTKIGFFKGLDVLENMN